MNFLKMITFFMSLFLVMSAWSESLHDYKYQDINGAEKSFSEYKGKVVLIVNTASECGYTGQYEGLEKLYKEYKEKGLVIIGFPCNQFGSQEPGSEQEIQKFCKLRYGVSFPLGKKIQVNGEQAADFYKFLKQKKLSGLDGEIKWNFEKILVDKAGNPVGRFRSSVAPEDEKLMVQINSLL